eukprot:1617427-Alexandrium_andersonii.AAC.1
MSASLVGSEMCIRDRSSFKHPAATALPAPVMRCAAARASSCTQRGKMTTCLLYTSDAADDM